ncbi:MAG TPA: response regulator [Bacteroidota bacterium]|nr:response regulator [Bacteroidota bacterium]
MKQQILIIEDNEQNMYLLTFLLESHGYEIVQAYNGKDGIRSARERVPDVILLDIQLPEMNGYEVAEKIRETPSLERVPIIAVTSYAMPGDREQILAAGATGYIEKPINPDTFISQLQEYLPLVANDGTREQQ